MLHNCKLLLVTQIPTNWVPDVRIFLNISSTTNVYVVNLMFYKKFNLFCSPEKRILEAQRRYVLFVFSCTYVKITILQTQILVCLLELSVSF